MKSVRFTDIYERLKQVTGLGTSEAISKKVGINRSTISTLLNREKKEIENDPKRVKSIPYQPLIDFALHNNISLDWLLTGEERPQEQTRPSSDSEASTVHQILSEFGQWADQMGRGSPNFPGWLGFELEKVKKRAVED